MYKISKMVLLGLALGASLGAQVEQDSKKKRSSVTTIAQGVTQMTDGVQRVVLGPLYGTRPRTFVQDTAKALIYWSLLAGVGGCIYYGSPLLAAQLQQNAFVASLYEKAIIALQVAKNNGLVAMGNGLQLAQAGFGWIKEFFVQKLSKATMLSKPSMLSLVETGGYKNSDDCFDLFHPRFLDNPFL